MEKAVIKPTRVQSKSGQVESFLLQNIQQGVFKPKSQLPSESTLVKTLDVSRVTVRRAIQSLIRSGVLRSQPGSGHIVCGSEPRASVAILFGHEFFDPQSVPFHGLLIASIQKKLTQLGWGIRIYMTRVCGREHARDRDLLISHIKNRYFEAILSVDWPCPPEIDAKVSKLDEELVGLIKTLNVPWVGIADHDVPNAVGTNYFEIGRLGASYFLDCDVSRIGLVMPNSPDRSQYDVLVGFREAMAERNVSIDERYICKTNEMSERGGYESFKKWWGNLDEKTDAIVISDDVIGKGVMIAASELGLVANNQLEFACMAIRGSRMFFPVPFAALVVDPEEYANEATSRLAILIKTPQRVLERVNLKASVVTNYRELEGGVCIDSASDSVCT